MSRLTILAAAIALCCPLPPVHAQQQSQRPPLTSQPADAAIRDALRRTATEVRFDAAPLDDVFRDLAQRMGINVHVSWNQLVGFGVDTQSQVTVHLRGVIYHQLISLILLDVACSPYARATVVNGVLAIGTPDNGPDRFVTRTYALHDLLPRNPSQADGASQEPQFDDDGVIDELVAQCIEPDSWEQNGGEGSIELLGPIAVVRQSPGVHEQVAGLLAALRQTPPRGSRWVPDSLGVEQHRATQTLEKLNRPLPHARLDHVPFQRAITDLGKQLGVNTLLLRRSITESGVDLDALVSMDLRNVPATRVLEQILRDVRAKATLTFDVCDNVLVVGTADLLDEQQCVRVYDAADLISYAGGASRFTEILCQTIEPDTWAANGGKGSCDTFCGRLVIANSPRIQRLVEKILVELRESARK